MNCGAVLEQGSPTSCVSCSQDTFDVRYPLNSDARADIAGSPTWVKRRHCKVIGAGRLYP
jgi:hypothetical protein